MSDSFKCKVGDQSALLVVDPDQVTIIRKGWFGRKETLRSIPPSAITELEWRMGKQGTKEDNFFISYTEGDADRVAALSVDAPGLVYSIIEEVRPKKDLGRQHGDVTPADLPTHETRPIHGASQVFERQKPPVPHRRARKP